MRRRFIPVLTIEGPSPRLVKTVKFKKPNYLGDPINAIKIFNDKMVDEIVILDISASRQGREPNFELIYEMAGECFSPLGYGGGITNFEQVKKLFKLGVEKIILNSATPNGEQLIRDSAELFGSQSVVACIDVRKKLFGPVKPHFFSATKSGSEDVIDWAHKLVSWGVGELIVQDVDRDGTFEGLNHALIKEVAEAVNVPVIACGGARSLEDMELAITSSEASGVAAGSLFVYRNNDPKSILINYPLLD
jgi:imidazole glycerol-phosphate synthase subunit HisF